MSVQMLTGDCREVMAGLEAESVHCVVTSAPFYGLRDYSVAPSVWGGSPDCTHDWATDTYYREGGNSSSSALAFSEPGPENAARLKETRWRENTVCSRCGAWRGCLGLERTLPEYIAHIVEIFREVRRVLRKDGTVWANWGDSYATGAGAVGGCPGGGPQGERWAGYRGTRGDSPKHAASAVGPMTQPNRMPQPGLKPKDLMMVPHRVAIALQEDGWWVRSDIVWHKPNPMPESVTDRPTKAHEYIFLLTKSERYFYDAAAVLEPTQSGPSDIRKMLEGKERIGGKHKDLVDPLHRASRSTRLGQLRAVGSPTGRNRRSVWVVPTTPFRGAHFAVFPEKLIEPCILAGTSERGCCPECGAPWERVQERTGHVNSREPAHVPGNTSSKTDSTGWAPVSRGTDEWTPGCGHAAAAIPCTVLDPFMGSGTTLLVAARHHRNAIGIELNPEYVAMAEKRLSQYQSTLPFAESAS